MLMQIWYCIQDSFEHAAQFLQKCITGLCTHDYVCSALQVSVDTFNFSYQIFQEKIC